MTGIWKDFIRRHLDVLAGTDFFTVEASQGPANVAIMGSGEPIFQPQHSSQAFTGPLGRSSQHARCSCRQETGGEG
jgi:hypothetical protein